MGKLPVLKAREVIAALENYILRHPDGRRVVVPYHGNRDIKHDKVFVALAIL